MEVRRKIEDGLQIINRNAGTRSPCQCRYPRPGQKNANYFPSFLSNSEPVFLMLCTRYKPVIHLNPWKSWNH
jgi:hypothetical protein